MAASEEANGNHGDQPPSLPLEQPQLSCLMVPLLAMGHIIPMMDLGLLLAEQGISVTLFTTPANAERIAPSASRAREAFLPFIVTPLPYHVDGLPDGTDNADLTSSASELETLMHGLGQLEAPFREHLKGIDPSRAFMVSDFCHPWTRHVSHDLGIPRYIFYSVPCFSLFCHRALQQYYDAGGAEDEFELFVVPGLPHRIELTRARAPGFFVDPVLRQEVEAGETSSDGIIVNAFAALEGEYLGLYQKEIAKVVWPVGPVALHNSGNHDRVAVRGNTPSVAASQIFDWLDRQNPASVVYICLGSLAQTTTAQAVEIGLGLEASGHPFLWVIRTRRSQIKETDAWLAAGFEERTKDRGLVIRGWAPQQLILSHAAVGGFLTHCGWNSCSEALASGVPVATWPCFSEQFVNERFLVDVLQVGVAIGVKEPQWWWSDDLNVGRGRVKEVVDELMGDGEKANRRRARAREIGVEARKAIQAGKGESLLNIAALIQDAARRARARERQVQY